MRTINAWIVGSFLFLGLSASAQTGKISGQVSNVTGAPMAGISGFAKSASGTVYPFTTNGGGQFVLNQLPRDKYIVTVTPPVDHIIVSPQQGLYKVDLVQDPAPFLPFFLRTTGISMDFGKPPPQSNKPGSGSSSGSSRSTSESAEGSHSFPTPFYLRNPNWTDAIPDQVELVGTWQLFPASTEDVWITHIALQDPSGTAWATYENLAGNNFRIEIHDPYYQLLTDSGYLIRVHLESSDPFFPAGHVLYVVDERATFSALSVEINSCPIQGLIID